MIFISVVPSSPLDILKYSYEKMSKKKISDKMIMRARRNNPSINGYCAKINIEIEKNI